MKLTIDPPNGAAWNSPPILAMAAVFFALTLFLTTRANTFPVAYHPDEPSKARQVINREYNFHHPMLMLSAATLAVESTGAGTSAQQVAVAGRWVSATFTSAAVFCLVVMTASLFGTGAGAAAGALLASNHQLFELAHYFKEDTAVLFGMSAFFLALVLYDERPSGWRALFLGIATGLAVSGKYVGIFVAPLAISIVFIRCGRCKAWLPLAIWLAGTIAVFAAANFPIFLNPAGFASGFERELEFTVAGHKGITRSVPHGVYGAVFRESTNPAIWILLVIFAIGLLLRARRARPSEWMITLFPLVFAVILSFSPKTHHRYFLPATGLLLALAAAGAILLPRFRWSGRPLFGGAAPLLVSGVSVLIALAVQAPRFFAYYDGFSHDGRTVMAEYLRQNVPPGTTIVQDKRVHLRELDLPHRIEGKQFAADEGTLDELRNRGVEYVAVAEGDYGRFFRENFRPTDEAAAEYFRRRSFYEQLFGEGKLVLDCKTGTLQYLQPHIQLYRIK